jgi:hypothetical protein
MDKPLIVLLYHWSIPKDIADKMFEGDKIKYEKDYMVGRGVSYSTNYVWENIKFG